MAFGDRGGSALGLGRIYGEGTLAGYGDGQLLERFVATRDEAAFAMLVGRLGPMVMGVCRAALPDRHDAEDAFQATFLVLARRAGAIRDRSAVGPWLYGVAHRVAARARVETARRRARESKAGWSGHQAPATDALEGASALERDEVGPAIHEELARLPEKYRKPVVLCYLQGRSNEEAALDLGWPVGTIKGRLARARGLLRDRLVRRGVAPSIAIASSTLLTRSTRASIPSELLNRAVRVALGAGGSVSPTAATAATLTLANEVTRTMIFAKLKLIAAACLLTTTAAGATALFAITQQPTPEPARDSHPADSNGSPEPQKVENASREATPESSDQGSAEAPKILPTDPEPSLKFLSNDMPALTAEEQEIDTRLGDGSAAVMRALRARVEMHFPEATPLSELVAYVQSVVTTPDFPRTIPVYVDPIGLEEQEVTLESPIQLDLRTIPLRRTLQLALRPLGLSYAVMDGMIVISSPDQLDQLLLGSAIHEVSERARLEQKFVAGVANVSEIKLLKTLEGADGEGSAPTGGGGFQ